MIPFGLASFVCLCVYLAYVRHDMDYASATCTVDATWLSAYGRAVKCGTYPCDGHQCTLYCDTQNWRGYLHAWYDVDGTRYTLEQLVFDEVPTHDAALATLAAWWPINATFTTDYSIADPSEHGDLRHAQRTKDGLLGSTIALAVVFAVWAVAFGIVVHRWDRTTTTTNVELQDAVPHQRLQEADVESDKGSAPLVTVAAAVAIPVPLETV
jgi:hypothetical protein